jgi:ribosomal protein L11 methyltransferase
VSASLCKLRIAPAGSTAAADAAGQVAAALVELIEPAADAVARFATADGWYVEAYYADPPDPAALSAELAALLGIAPPVVTAERVANENWVAISQAALPPVVSGRFVVHGSHDRGAVPRGPNAIEIDAGEAFGTAHHATTASCLLVIDRLARRSTFRRVLDLGCGSGVLAIAAARVWPRAKIDALDTDPAAVAVARANVRGNGASSVHVARTKGALRRIREPRNRYDLIVANILAGPLIALAPAIARAVHTDGTLVLSGILESEAREVRNTYLSHGFIVSAQLLSAGWATLTLIRTRPGNSPHRPSPARPRGHSRSRAAVRRSG